MYPLKNCIELPSTDDFSTQPEHFLSFHSHSADDLALFSNYCYIFLRQDWDLTSPFKWYFLRYFIIVGCTAHSMSVESIWNVLKPKETHACGLNFYFCYSLFSFLSFSLRGFIESSYCCVVRNTFVNLCALLLISIQKQILSLSFSWIERLLLLFRDAVKEACEYTSTRWVWKAREAFKADRWSIN